MPFRIVLDTLLRISPEEIGISCGSEQTCRRRVILFNFFPIWTFGGVYIYGYELGAPVFAHLHELLSFKFSKAEMFFSIFNILYRCFYHLMTSVNFFKDRVFATCEWNDWERERVRVFSSRWSHCGYTTIETLWLFFQGKKRRFFNRWSNFTKQQRERRRAFVGSLERMLVSSMLNNWKQYVKENKALRWVGRSWVTLELLLHVVKWPNCWRARAWVERHDRFSLAKLFSCKISVHDPLVALNYSCNLEPFANTENWFLLSCAIE